MMHISAQRNIVWIGLFVFFTSGLCSNNKSIKLQQLFSEKGLPGSIVNCLYQDSYGYMWFGIEAAGLHRYNGVSLKGYTHERGETFSLSNNFVNVVYEDQDKNLWVGTTGGLDIMDSSKTTMLHFFDNLPDANVKVNAIIKAPNGLMLIGTNNGLYTLNSIHSQPQRICLNSGNEPRVRSFFIDDSGNIWIGTTEGLYKWNSIAADMVESTENMDITSIDQWREFIVLGSSKGVLLYDSVHGDLHQARFNQEGLYNDGVVGIRKLLIDRQGRWWVATMQYGMICASEADLNEQFQFTNTAEVEGLITGTITDILQDKNQNIWVASKYDGLYLYDQRLQLFEGVEIKHPYKELFVMSLCEDDDGTLWLGSRTQGLFNIRKGTDVPSPVVQYGIKPGLIRRIEALLYDDNGSLWVGSEKGCLIKNLRKGSAVFHELEHVWAFGKDQNNQIWIASSKGLFIYDDKEQKIVRYQSMKNAAFFKSQTQVGLIKTSDDGSLWFGTFFNGLYRYLPSIDSLQHYTTDVSSPLILSDNSIRSFYEDQNHKIWIGTRSQGLNCLDFKNDTVIYFLKSNGLASNAIYNILPDEANYLWLGSDMGLIKFSLSDYSVENYNREYGLPTSVFEPRSSSLLKNGHLAFGYNNGVITFDPLNIRKISKETPLIVSTIASNGKPVVTNINKNYKLELNYNQNQLSFEFALLDYAISSRNKYRYKLSGFDHQWQGPTEYPQAQYTNLKPGYYQFYLEATNYQNDWSKEPLIIDITINQPFYNTVWAYLGYIVLVILIGFVVYQIVITQLKLKLQVKMAHEEVQKTIEMETEKIQFFTNVAHEFQTPLTLILAPLEKVMEKISAYSETTKHIQLIKKQTNHLQKLIEELLLFRKVQASTGSFKPVLGHVEETVNGILMDFYELAKNKNIKLNYSSKLEPIAILFDSDKLSKVINNLLMNSFKYTPRGGEINILIDKVRLNRPIVESRFWNFKKVKDQSAEFISISISDTGEGMAEEELEKVFSRFYQSSARGLGAGIGLSLAQALVELHGGFIECKSKKGKGSTFTIYLPQNVSHSIVLPNSNYLSPAIPALDVPRVKKWEVSDTNALNSKQLILIVDDNKDLLIFLAENLNEKYQVLTADDGEEALSLAIEHVPDLIISDVVMPKLDGLALCSQLKQMPATSHIPVILLTTQDSYDDKVQGLKTGADDYLPKPFNMSYLELRINGLLQLRSNIQKQAKANQKEGRAPIKGISKYDQDFLIKIKLLMMENLSEPDFGVESLAKAVGLSRAQLNRKINALLNQTPTEYIYDLRLREAIHLLAEEGLNVSDTAYKTGFKSPSSFSTVFKNKFGVPPSRAHEISLDD